MINAVLNIVVILWVAIASSAFRTEIAETAPQPVAPGFHVVSAILTPVPQAYDGPCPVTFKFEGKITVKGKGSVRYTFVRSDGATGPEYSLDFGSDETRPVSTTWTLSTPVLEGWQAIKILSPTAMESNRAFFKGKCIGAEAEPFRVTAATLKIGSLNNRGPCPVTVEFMAYIRTNRAGVVKYTFTRSDGASAPVQTLVFDAAGWKEVPTTWTLGGPELPHYWGWQGIKILSPNEMVDSRKFEVTCTKPERPTSPPERSSATSPVSVYTAMARTYTTSRRFRVGETVILKVENNTAGPIYYLLGVPEGTEIIRGEGLVVQRLDRGSWISVVNRSLIDEPAYTFIDLRRGMNLTR